MKKQEGERAFELFVLYKRHKYAKSLEDKAYEFFHVSGTPRKEERKRLAGTKELVEKMEEIGRTHV